MLDGMTPDEFRGWMIKDQVEPIGYGNQMLGLIAWYLHASLTKETTLTMDDFMPWTRHQNDATPHQQPWNLWQMATGNK